MSRTIGSRPQPTPQEMLRAVTLFKVLSHPDRLRLACALGDGRVTTQKEILKEFGWPQSTTARHITALRNAGLIRAERAGSEVLLELGTPIALQLLDTVCAYVHEGTAPESMIPALTDVIGSPRLWAAASPARDESDPSELDR